MFVKKTIMILMTLFAWVWLFNRAYVSYRMPRAMEAYSGGEKTYLDPRTILSMAEKNPEAFNTREMRFLLDAAQRNYRDTVGGGILYGILSFLGVYFLFRAGLALQRRVRPRN